MLRLKLCSLATIFLPFLASSSSLAQQSVPSDAFVDSVGVNIHLSYSQTLYGKDFALVQSSLTALGIRHIRDGLSPWPDDSFYIQHHKALAAQGITGVFLTVANQPPSLLENFPKQVGSFEAYEYPNEPDAIYGFPGDVTAYGPTIYATSAGAYPVLGPALTRTASYPVLGNISANLDFGNIHDYWAGRNPGTAGWGSVGCGGTHAYGNLTYDLDCVHEVSGTKPVWATETGYGNYTGQVNWVTEAVSATYEPRILLEHWNAGIKRTYLYELIEEGTDGYQGYGLIRADGTQKPAFLAIANLLNLLSDPGAPFTPAPLDYSILGGDSYLHKLLLQKRDGSFYLALWVEKPCYDPNAHVNITVAPEPITLSTSHSFDTASVYQLTTAGTMTETDLQGGVSSLHLSVTDKVMIVKLTVPAGTFQLSTSVMPAGAGTVTTEPAITDGQFPIGSNVTLTAAPSNGFVFDNFSGAYTLYGKTLSLTSSSNVSEVAHFHCTYSLSQSAMSFDSAAGSASFAASSGTGCAIAPVASDSWLTASAVGGTVTVAAAANTGQTRTGQITVGDATMVVTQHAAGIVFAKLASNVVGGSISIDGNPYPVGSNLRWLPGDTHIVGDYPAQNIGGVVYLFQQWTSGLSGTGQQAVSVPSTDMTITEQMVPGVSLNPIGNGGGTVVASPAGVQFGSLQYYLPTDVVTVTAVPNPGCTLKYWTKGTTTSALSFTLQMTQPANPIAKFECTTVAQN